MGFGGDSSPDDYTNPKRKILFIVPSKEPCVINVHTTYYSSFPTPTKTKPANAVQFLFPYSFHRHLFHSRSMPLMMIIDWG